MAFIFNSPRFQDEKKTKIKIVYCSDATRSPASTLRLLSIVACSLDIVHVVFCTIRKRLFARNKGGATEFDRRTWRRYNKNGI